MNIPAVYFNLPLNTQGDSFFYDKMPSVINKPRNCIGNGMFAKNVKRLECVKQKGNKKHTPIHTEIYTRMKTFAKH